MAEEKKSKSKVGSPGHAKQELGLPNDAEFCGYLIHVEDRDEFLGMIKETSLTIQRGFVGTPESAHRFKTYEEANKLSRSEKHEVVVGLFDIGKQFVIYRIDQ